MKHQWWSDSGGGGILAALWLANPMTVALLRPGFVPNLDVQKVWADVAGSEVANGNGYATGGQLLANRLAPYDAAADQFNLQADDTAWDGGKLTDSGPGATFDAAFAVIYNNSGAKELWSLIDFEGTKSVQAGVFTLDFAATGVLYVATLPAV